MQLGSLLDSVAGFSALQLSDNATAEKDLRAAVADPNNVENVYPLALASPTATPEDDAERPVLHRLRCEPGQRPGWKGADC